MKEHNKVLREHCFDTLHEVLVRKKLDNSFYKHYLTSIKAMQLSNNIGLPQRYLLYYKKEWKWQFYCILISEHLFSTHTFLTSWV